MAAEASSDEVGYCEAGTDDSFDSDDLMDNVRLVHSEKDRTARAARRQTGATTAAKAKGKEKRAAGAIEVKPDLFDPLIRATDAAEAAPSEQSAAMSTSMPSTSSSSALPSSVSSSSPSSFAVEVVDRATLQCALCGGGDSAEAPLPGPGLGPHPLRLGPDPARPTARRAWLHDDCAALSPEVFHDGDQWCALEKCVRRGELLKCSACGSPGATLGCLVAACRYNYHVPCAVATTGWACRDKRTGEAVPFYCAKHRPKFPTRPSGKGGANGKGKGRAAPQLGWPLGEPLDRDWLLGHEPLRGIGKSLFIIVLCCFFHASLLFFGGVKLDC
jgi:hypothetical protein